MAEYLSMSLDDIIRKNQKSEGNNGNFRGRGRDRGRGGLGSRLGSGPGPSRQFPNRFLTRTAPYSAPQAIHAPEMLMGGRSTEGGTKLYISNLDYGVSNEDIKVLFSEVGELKRYSIHYDCSGRSKGTAEVAFVHQSDALAAVKRYNNLLLDGRPLKIELVGMTLVTSFGLPPPSSLSLGNPNTGPRRQVTSSRWDYHSGNYGPSAGRGHGGGKSHKEMVSAEDLDADLEKYHLEAMHLEAMQIN